MDHQPGRQWQFTSLAYHLYQSDLEDIADETNTIIILMTLPQIYCQSINFMYKCIVLLTNSLQEYFVVWFSDCFPLHYCSGDCRAVLGSLSQDGLWQATPLSSDQTAANPDEVKRLQSEHPGEENVVIKNGRLLGQLQPLRSFGDIQYKWDKVTHSHVLTQVYGGPIVPPSMYKTPPYLTAKPVITQHKLNHHDKFLILATDGLWDVLSNEQAVGLVADFLNQQSEDKEYGTKSELLEHNAATHLIRHALGGNDHNFVAQMLLVPDQYRRMWRDDITVTVVFFNADTILSKL